VSEENSRYKIIYKDQTELVVFLTDEQYRRLGLGICKGEPAIIVDGLGVLRLEDIRSVIYVPEVPMNESYDPELSDEQREYMEYLKLTNMLLKSDEVDSDEDNDTLGGIPV